MKRIALLSVSDKEGLVPLAEALCKEHNFIIISSGGTASLLEKENIPVTRVSEYTGAEEILGGRVKTLHPKVHGGILAKRSDLKHQEELKQQQISQIDLVVVNLYPFRETVADPQVSWEKAIENIDIGGPAMLRAAAKNHAYVTVLSKPSQYENFLKALKNNGLTEKVRRQLALEAFEHTASYDIAISKWIQDQTNRESPTWFEAIPIKQKLRYGENPHQMASWFSYENQGWGGASQIQGKELSTNNLLDLEAAIRTIYEFDYKNGLNNEINEKAAVVIKHTNPCGLAIGSTASSALGKAIQADPISAFGGIIALNCPLDGNGAKEISDLFLECIVAPKFEQDAQEILSKKKNLRLIELSPTYIENTNRYNIRSILGGVLIQDQDDAKIDFDSWISPTKSNPSSEELDDLSFAWRLVRHVRSNAIVVASNGQSLGIGAGQMNRIGAAKIALESAGDKCKGSVLASDGFFPFGDTVRLAAKHGISSIIQPGGSIRDDESIKACDELGISMVFTGKRHFLH